MMQKCPICNKKKDCFIGTKLITGEWVNVCQDCWDKGSHFEFTVFK